ncbi:hypothetical protein ITJ88_14330 [Exiguobacterium sp. TBG-PICH-001]|uniref:AbiJ-related protein n=1 Tax=Exiguobacterium abrahamii TaxID=2785532 RepID=UPI0018A7D8EF|nr:hypothetical protein [Exiguobacterium sp. TBG-PICH-001]MBF8154458.1 hypothetical protein [Exiguobacterium sp. TBG-PICH-001]
MNRISELTKRDIFDLFQNGITISEFFETKQIVYPYFGRIEELDFLKRIYDLKSLPSYDARFSDAEGDICQHTINNDDYPYGWVFEDERFQLENGDDETYLKFICEIFHPVVRDEKGYWKEFLDEVNKLLKHDGYELYCIKKISNRDVYGWKLYQPNEAVFTPFSQRNKQKIRQKQMQVSIKKEGRLQIYTLFKKYDYIESTVSETGWRFEQWISDNILQELGKFYTPKFFNDKKQYVETNNLKDFILSNFPYYVLDAIEIFLRYSTDNFINEINTIFDLNNISLKLVNGKVENSVEHYIKGVELTSIEETGLKELLKEANKYYEKENFNIAVEKIWDAFERLKTYYSPTLDKKKSVSKIIEDVSSNKEPFKDLFNKEFIELTTIGNNFRIRHHEITKIDIDDERHYDYFYKRCLSLITTVLEYLNYESKNN